jgi:hypothetical protein
MPSAEMEIKSPSVPTLVQNTSFANSSTRGVLLPRFEKGGMKEILEQFEKSPLAPLFKALAKRGSGDFSAECNGKYVANFWDRRLAYTHVYALGYFLALLAAIPELRFLGLITVRRSSDA